MNDSEAKSKGSKPKLVGCYSCPGSHYSRSMGRCLLGMSNPKGRKAAQEIADIMGSWYICKYNRKALGVSRRNP